MDLQWTVLQLYNWPSMTVAAAAAALVLAAMWKLFTKAGEPGWKCLIPLYGSYILVKIADGNGWKFLLLLVPVVNIVFAVILACRLARSFGKGGGFAVGLLLLCVVFFPILGFGGARYVGPRGKAKER